MTVTFNGSMQRANYRDFVVEVHYANGMTAETPTLDASNRSQADVMFSGRTVPGGTGTTVWYVIYTDGGDDWTFDLKITQVGNTSIYTFKKKRSK